MKNVDFGYGTQGLSAGMLAVHLKAAAGDAQAQSYLSNCYLRGKGVSRNPVEAVHWARKAAPQGLAEAQVVLGVCCQSGDGMEPDPEEGVRWFRLAAEQGVPEAQFNLAFALEHGIGTHRDLDQARHWLLQAEAGNCARAKAVLGIWYITGRFVPPDERLGVNHLLSASICRDPFAFIFLGWCFSTGCGVSQSDERAEKLYRMGEGVLGNREKLLALYELI